MRINRLKSTIEKRKSEWIVIYVWASMYNEGRGEETNANKETIIYIIGKQKQKSGRKKRNLEILFNT